MTDIRNKIDMLWDDDPIDVTAEANFIWSIANKLRGTYMPDKYGDVIIPMTILRRFECALSHTKDKVIEAYEKNPALPALALEKKSGFQFYNTSRYDLKELQNESDKIVENFINYLEGFSPNVQEIMKELDMKTHIEKMDKGGCLLNVIKDFSQLDLDPSTYDSIKMGYIFENLIGRFYQNVDAGQFYTGRDIIKCIVSILTAEGCDDIFDDHKVITVCDQACGTGGMLSTAYSYLKRINPTADIRLFGQEFMGQSYAVGLAEMLIKGQDARNFRHTDTFKEDCFKNTKMRFVIENPPFGTAWSGEKAKTGQEKAVKDEYDKRMTGTSRWGAGLPSGSDSQLIFMQSAIDKMDEKLGRAAIIQNGSPLFSGNTASGESQIRRWMLENDLIESIIALPPDLFYNTGIQTFVWILSKNKSEKRKGKVQLIDASAICHRLRKPVGDKKNEILPEDRIKITKVYTNFEENEICKIFKNSDFIFREYSIYQPLQRVYTITDETIDNLIRNGYLNSLFDEVKYREFDELGTAISASDKKKMQKMEQNRPIYNSILAKLKENIGSIECSNPENFLGCLKKIFIEITIDNKLLLKIVDGLSVRSAKGDIQKDKKGNIIFDKETKDIEFVNLSVDINEYMKSEVIPHKPDAVAFFEENLTGKKPIIKTGAEIPFTKYFYKYTTTRSSEDCLKEFISLNDSVNLDISKLLEE